MIKTRYLSMYIVIPLSILNRVVIGTMKCPIIAKATPIIIANAFTRSAAFLFFLRSIEYISTNPSGNFENDLIFPPPFRVYYSTLWGGVQEVKQNPFARSAHHAEGVYIIRNLLRYIIKAERFASHQVAGKIHAGAWWYTRAARRPWWYTPHFVRRWYTKPAAWIKNPESRAFRIFWHVLTKKMTPWKWLKSLYYKDFQDFWQLFYSRFDGWWRYFAKSFPNILSKRMKKSSAFTPAPFLPLCNTFSLNLLTTVTLNVISIV